MTWNPKSWRFGRWFSFSIGWFLGFMLIFRGVKLVDDYPFYINRWCSGSMLIFRGVIWHTAIEFITNKRDKKPPLNDPKDAPLPPHLGGDTTTKVDATCFFNWLGELPLDDLKESHRGIIGYHPIPSHLFKGSCGCHGGDLQLALWKKQQNDPCQSLSSILLGTFLSHCCRVLCHGIHIHSTECQPQPNGGFDEQFWQFNSDGGKKERITKKKWRNLLFSFTCGFKREHRESPSFSMN